MSDRRLNILRKMTQRMEISTSLFYNGTPCWLWTGPTSGQNGRGRDYPRMTLNGQTVAVHIVMYTHVYGFVPGKKTIDHECGNRLCISPWHLSMVSHRENCRRRDGKAPHKASEHRVTVPEYFIQELFEVGVY